MQYEYYEFKRKNYLVSRLQKMPFIASLLYSVKKKKMLGRWKMIKLILSEHSLLSSIAKCNYIAQIFFHFF
jgi:hypothetical protein